MNLGLEGRRALVLGASRGLGAAVARLLAVEGASVVAASRSGATSWSETLDEPTRRRVEACRIDVSDRVTLTALIVALLDAGPIDILVNNSGGPPPGPLEDVAAERWDQHFATMATHLFEVARLVLPGMRERRWGRIVTIASSGVEQPIPGLGLSNSVRAAVVGWSKTLSNEVALDGVTVNVVLPGRIHTSRVDELDAAAAARAGSTPAEVASASAAAIPVGRYGTPDEFAAAVAFLSSRQASYITGSRIRVDGGMIRSI